MQFFICACSTSDFAYLDAQDTLSDLETTSIFSRVDRLLDGTDIDKQSAYEELTLKQNQV